MELEERSKDIKRQKVFEKEMIKIFQVTDSKTKCYTWDECAITYNISEKMYRSLFLSCLSWLDGKLQQTKATPEFPSVTKGYVKWIVSQKYGSTSSTTAFPWSIKTVGSNLEGIDFLGDGTMNSKLSVGVCILDATNGLIAEGKWSPSHFERVIDGLCSITIEPSQFVFVAFIHYMNIAALETALTAKAGHYDIHVISLDSLFSRNARPLVPLNEYCFGVVITFAKEAEFHNILELKDKIYSPVPCITTIVEDKSPMDMAKAHMVRHIINDVCINEDDQVVDILSLGIATKEAILLQRKVTSIVCTNEQAAKIEADCLTAVETSLALKKWAGLVTDATEEENEDILGEGDDLNLGELGSFLQEVSKAGEVNDATLEKVDEDKVERVDNMIWELVNDIVDTLPIQVNNIDLCKFSKSSTREAKKMDNIAEQSIECSHLGHSLVNEDMKGARFFYDDAESKTTRESKEKGTLVATTSSLNNIQDKPTLTVILSLTGLLLRRCWQKSPIHKSFKLEPDYLVLRPGCITFLSTLTTLFNVGIWSTASDNNVVNIISALEREVHASLPFFMVWGQDGCRTCEKQRICRPDNPGAEAFFKPLALASKVFQFDARRSILIDDTPYKACVNPTDNCIFPPTFDINKEDNTLLGELLPYLKDLNHAADVRDIIRTSRYGKDPISEGHEWYNAVEVVVKEWRDANTHWAEMQYNTGKLPPHTKNLGGADGSSSSHPYSTRSQSKGTKVSLDQGGQKLLRNAQSLSKMKGMEAIILAQKLGFKGPFIDARVAKSYLKELLRQHGLKSL